MRDLDNIVENERIKQYFLSARSFQKVSHFYIIEGEKGSGKKLLAWTFSKMLLCESGGREACDVCSSCVQMNHRDHPDVIWVTHTKPDHISVDEIRTQVVNTIDIIPYKSPYKIYIIDEAEKMGAATQNALLKSLEEPPEYCILFLLTTNRGALLDTILSRGITIPVKPVSDAGMRRYLKQKYPVTPDQENFVIGFSMGNIGKAIRILSSDLFGDLLEETLKILREVDRFETWKLIKKGESLKEYKGSIDDFFDICLVWYRDVLVAKSGGTRSSLIFSGEAAVIQKQGRTLSFFAINDIFREIDRTRGRIKANVNFEAALEEMLLEIADMYHR